MPSSLQDGKVNVRRPQIYSAHACARESPLFVKAGLSHPALLHRIYGPLLGRTALVHSHDALDEHLTTRKSVIREKF